MSHSIQLLMPSLGDSSTKIPPSALSQRNHYIILFFVWVQIVPLNSPANGLAVSYKLSSVLKEKYIRWKNEHDAETPACGAQSCETQRISLSKWTRSFVFFHYGIKKNNNEVLLHFVIFEPLLCMCGRLYCRVCSMSYVLMWCIHEHVCVFIHPSAVLYVYVWLIAYLWYI